MSEDASECWKLLTLSRIQTTFKTIETKKREISPFATMFQNVILSLTYIFQICVKMLRKPPAADLFYVRKG